MSSRLLRLWPVTRHVLVTSRCLSTSSRLMLAKDDQDDKLKAELDELTKKLNEDLKQRPQETEQELDKNFMNFRRLREKAEHERSYIFGWKTVTATLGLIGCALAGLLYMRKIRLDEQTKQRKIMAGKARIGGEWELVNSEGKLEGSKDLLGNWVLMYFGFTNCPDICPDEIEKMVDVVDMLDKDKEPIPVVPVFITVDPIRDNAARVKKYCAEFSPKIRGYTGDKEQTEKVLKTFRIYHSQGPPAAGEEDDYIVDHTVMMYLIDPEGNFFDYYGQTRRAGEIANVIRTKVLSYQLNKKKGYFFKMATHQLPIKTDLKVEQNADSPSNVQSQPASNEFQVIVPENANKKRYSILQFNGPLNVDPGHWPQAQVAMAREDNRAHTIGPSENIQEFGEGSEYGRAAREEARRKKYGRQTRTYHHDRQPWQLLLRDGNGSAKDRIFRSVCEGGAGAHSDYWVFLKAGNNFHAHKVDDWFRFMPNPQKKGLDIDQVEEQFQQRNKVLNQFALKMKIQQTIKDQDEDGEKMSKPSLLKIKDEASSDEEDNNGEESKRDEDEETSSNKKGKKKKGKEARERKDKKQRVKNADEVAAYESEDGEDEGREYDYISDSGSNTSREEMTVDEKVDQAMIAVGDETGMRDDASDEESMDDSEDENQDEAAKQKRNLLKKLNEQKEGKTDEEKTLRLTDKLDERDSSGSDTDDPDNPKGHQSVLFLQAKARKRHAEDEEEVNEDEPAKRAKPPTREQTPQPLSASQPSTSAVVEIDGLNEDTVRRMLMQRPMSTKDLVGKFRAKMPNMSKEDVVTRLAEILGVLKPERVNRTVNKKNVLYFSLTKNH